MRRILKVTLAATVLVIALIIAYAELEGSHPSISETGMSTTSTSPSTTASAGLHQVAFHQTGNCNGLYTAPWSVTMGNMTETEPPGGTVPTYGFSGGLDYAIYSTIFFHVPDGTYNYSVSPAYAFNQAGPATGIVTVRGADVVVPVRGPTLPSCGSVNYITSATSTSTWNSTEGLRLDFSLTPNTDGTVTMTVDGVPTAIVPGSTYTGSIVLTAH